MKPVYLEMNYFGPHEHSIIDFRRLEEAPIFLIGGDTGAGKSTIFDAMTFALFGSTTSDRDAREMRSQFAPNNAQTSVTFYFEQGNNLYKVERTPEQMLEKKTKSKGLTIRKTTATLGVVDKVDGPETQSIASKPKDVGNEIYDILKLNADQFKKIILLPQNDFSEFLKAKTSDKESILKKIFGTQIFTEFTNKLKEKYDTAKQQSTDFETELKTQINSMKLSDEDLEKLNHEAPDQKIVILKSFVDTKKAQAKSAQAESDKVAKNLNKADKELQDAKNLQNKFKHLEDLKKQYKTNITDKKETMEARKQHIAELDWADQFKDTIRDLNKIKSEKEKNSKNKKTIDKQLESTQKDYDLAVLNLNKLTNQQSDIDLKNKRIDELANLIPLVTRVEKIHQDLENINPQIISIESNLKEQTQISLELTTEIDSKEKQLVNTSDLQKQKDSLIDEKSTLIDKLSPIENKKNNLKSELTNLQSKNTTLTSDLKIKQDKLEVAKKDYQEKIGTRQSLMIAQLQQELVEGQPCVVCGSTSHPNIVKTVQADEAELKKSIETVDTSQKNYAAAEQALKSAQKSFDDNNLEISTKKTDLESITKTLTNKYNELLNDSSKKYLPTKYDLQSIKNSFDEQITLVNDKLKNAEKLNKEITDLKDSLKESEKSISDIKLNLAESKSKQTTFENDLKELSKQVSNNQKTSEELSSEQTTLKKAIKTYTEQLENSKNQAHTSELALSSIQTQTTDITEQIQKQTTDIKELQTILDNGLNSKDAKTNDSDQLKDWIQEINDDIDSQLKEFVSSYNKEKELLDRDIKTISGQLKDLKIPDIDHLTENLNNQKELNKAAVNKAVQLKFTYDNFQSTYVEIKKITDDQTDFSKQLAEITGLYNVITGKDGNDEKLQLQTYVVQNYLRKVLDYANHTFINLLSNNRYSFEIAEQGSDKRTDHGLDINVYDNETGATRSSDTLSGGETFIAALSIALSLSEVVQSSANGVKIDALFIDEGFGSLDDETLGKAMSALETIGENRMVGVISHIETMKATIGQQVLIKKIGDGRSTVKIVTK